VDQKKECVTAFSLLILLRKFLEGKREEWEAMNSDWSDGKC
jgi:hypothetical protein